jgi:hypothetical protein
MEQQIDWAKANPYQYEAFIWQAQRAGALGQLRKAEELIRLASLSANRKGLKMLLRV